MQTAETVTPNGPKKEIRTLKRKAEEITENAKKGEVQNSKKTRVEKKGLGDISAMLMKMKKDTENDS